MKASIRYPPWSRLFCSILLGLFLSVTFGPVALAGDLAAFCADHPTHHKCPGGGDGGNDGEFELTITYTLGSCPGDDCATSELTATGTKHCDEQGHCNFNGDISPNAPDFNLPHSLMEMLNNDDNGGRYWKDTQLDAYACFGDQPSANPNGRGVELARHIVDESWFTAIGAYAWDVDGQSGDVTRKYVFYFLCDDPPCGDSSTWIPGEMTGTFEGGVLLRIESPPKLDGKLKSTPCRCTISNDPSCPHEAVPLSITVEEVQLD